MKLGCLFPGQGSQKVGMGKDLYDGLSFARERFKKADACLGFELSAIMFNGPMEVQWLRKIIAEQRFNHWDRSAQFEHGY